jgi:competence protein ComEA
MSATPPSLGVAAPSSTPPAAAPAWPDTAQLPVVASSLTNPTATTWPRPALWATVVVMLLALTLLVWNVYASSRWTTRPTTLEHGPLQTGRLDLNRADRVQLMQLSGVGEALAGRIVEYREEHHGFRDVDELRQVHGIGPVLLEKLRPHVYVEAFDADDETEPAEEMPRPVTPAQKPTPKPKQDKTPTNKKSSEKNGLIDVTRASVEELQRLPGIGPKLAERIVETRQKTPFKKVDDLRHVPGIGVKTLDHLRPLVTVGEVEAAKKD